MALLPIQLQTLTHTAGENTATASFRPSPPLELYLATHRLLGLTDENNQIAEVEAQTRKRRALEAIKIDRFAFHSVTFLTAAAADAAWAGSWIASFLAKCANI